MSFVRALNHGNRSFALRFCQGKHILCVPEDTHNHGIIRNGRRCGKNIALPDNHILRSTGVQPGGRDLRQIAGGDLSDMGRQRQREMTQSATNIAQMPIVREIWKENICQFRIKRTIGSGILHKADVVCRPVLHHRLSSFRKAFKTDNSIAQ